MGKIKTIFICFFLGMFFVHLAEASSTNTGLPFPYTRKNIEKQCENYRAVFDPIFRDIKKENPDISSLETLRKMSNTHAPGLLDILKDGIAITYNYITSSSDDSRKDPYVQYLQDFWALAQRIDKDGKLSARAFTALNQYLAHGLSDYKKAVLNLENDISSDKPNATPHDLIQRAIDLFSSPLEEQGRISNDGIALQERPIFILYAHPNPNAKPRGLSPKRFVEEYAHPDYPGYLALFDIHSNSREKGTKKEAHFSKSNGTFRFLRHDLSHILLMIRSEEKSNFVLHDIVQKGGEIEKQLSQEKRLNEVDVMESGLFMIFHELLAFLHAEQGSTLKTQADSAEVIMQNQFKRAGIRDDDYKAGVRNWEFILKTKDKDGISFLPQISIGSDKQRAFPIAKLGDEYFVIEKPEDYREGMTYMISHEGVPQDILQKRLTLLVPALQKATHRFWERFKELVEGA